MSGKLLKTYRVDGDLFAAVAGKAAEAGETVTDVIERGFRAYVAGRPPAPAPAPVKRSRAKADAPEGVPAVVFSEPDPPQPVVAPPPPVVVPSLRRASDLQAPPRCQHEGVRRIGGWCPKCLTDVKPGGKLPENWVMPEGWSPS